MGSTRTAVAHEQEFQPAPGDEPRPEGPRVSAATFGGPEHPFEPEPLEKLRRTAATDDAGSDADPNSVQQLAAAAGYSLKEQIGRGTCGVVYRAYDARRQRDVAIKFVDPSIAAGEVALGRFKREVALASQLEHPHILRVYHAQLDGPRPFCVMELIEGLPVDAYVRRHQRNLTDTLQLFATIGRAVQYAHRQGVIHRDLQPSNILIRENGEPCIIDFGLAKRTVDDMSANQEELSVDGQVIGSPGFMSPEQAAGHVKEIDHHTDIYALGAILFKLVTGHNPHDQSGPIYEVIHRIAHDPPRAPSSLNPRIPMLLEVILLAAVAQQQSARYQTVGAFADDLDAYLNGKPLSIQHVEVPQPKKARSWWAKLLGL